MNSINPEHVRYLENQADQKKSYIKSEIVVFVISNPRSRMIWSTIYRLKVYMFS